MASVLLGNEAESNSVILSPFGENCRGGIKVRTEMSGNAGARVGSCSVTSLSACLRMGPTVDLLAVRFHFMQLNPELSTQNLFEGVMRRRLD